MSNLKVPNIKNLKKKLATLNHIEWKKEIDKTFNKIIPLLNEYWRKNYFNKNVSEELKFILNSYEWNNDCLNNAWKQYKFAIEEKQNAYLCDAENRIENLLEGFIDNYNKLVNFLKLEKKYIE